ncbi:MAG: hypothetical protein AB7J35_18290 [Dehalococcoidia bacterium]
MSIFTPIPKKVGIAGLFRRFKAEDPWPIPTTQVESQVQDPYRPFAERCVKRSSAAKVPDDVVAAVEAFIAALAEIPTVAALAFLEEDEDDGFGQALTVEVMTPLGRKDSSARETVRKVSGAHSDLLAALEGKLGVGLSFVHSGGIAIQALLHQRRKDWRTESRRKLRAIGIFERD